MRKSIVCSIFCLIVAWTNAHGQRWVKTYGQIYDDRAHSIETTADNGFFVAGFNEQWPDWSGQAFAIKTNASGQIVWSKGYDEARWSRAEGRQLKNGNFLIWGQTKDEGKTSHDAFLIVLSPSGKILLQRAYGTENRDSYDIRHVEETRDGGYIACGSIRPDSDDDSSPNYKGWIIKINTAGKIVFQKTLTSNKTYGPIKYKHFVINDIRPTPDGRFICCGHHTDGAWIGKISGSGKLVWYKFLFSLDSQKDIEDISSTRVITTTDNGYVLTGEMWHDSFCAKIGGTGKMLWAKRFEREYPGDYVSIADIVNTKDGGYLLAGDLYISGKGSVAWLALINGAGRIALQQCYMLNNQNSYFKTAKPLPKGGFILAGNAYTDNFFFNGSKIISSAAMVMTVSANGLTHPGVKPKAYAALIKDIKLFPQTLKTIVSGGAAVERVSQFVATEIDFQEKTWTK